MSSIGFNLFDNQVHLQDKSSMDLDQLNELLSRNITSLMEEKGLNPSAWAKDSGLGHTAVRDIVSFKVKSPTYRTLVALAQTAGVDIRRITVGPNFSGLEADQSKAVDLLFQLEPSERKFLLNAAKAQIEARDRDTN